MIDQASLTEKAKRFIAANAESPVVYGSAQGPAGKPTGCYYRLANGQTFRLTSAECGQVGMPRWKL
jgi:hypothetical protein